MVLTFNKKSYICDVDLGQVPCWLTKVRQDFENGAIFVSVVNIYITFIYSYHI